jgi:DNA polymerase-3 subunit epsilon
VVDYQAACSELGALVLENRLIKRLRPAGNVRLAPRRDRAVYLRCGLDVAYPVLEVGADPLAGRAVNVGPVYSRRGALELVEQLDSLFGLRHCGRRLRRREHPSAYGQMGRCLSPCLGDLDPNLYRARLESALELFEGSEDGRKRLLDHVELEMRASAAAQRYERAAALRRRLARLRSLLASLGGILRATHSQPALVVAAHPLRRSFDAFWVVGGRVREWSSIPDEGAADEASLTELARRTERALACAAGPSFGGHVPADEVDEVRIVTGWLASHPKTPTLALDGAPTVDVLEAFLREACAAQPR